MVIFLQWMPGASECQAEQRVTSDNYCARRSRVAWTIGSSGQLPLELHRSPVESWQYHPDRGYAGHWQ